MKTVCSFDREVHCFKELCSTIMVVFYMCAEIDFYAQKYALLCILEGKIRSKVHIARIYSRNMHRYTHCACLVQNYAHCAYLKNMCAASSEKETFATFVHVSCAIAEAIEKQTVKTT